MRQYRRESLNPTVAARLQSAGRRWQWLLFWQLLSWLVIALMVGLVSLGLGIRAGWVSDSLVATLICVLIGMIFAFAFVVIVLVAAVQSKPNSWLAREIERRMPSLLDRVNTLAWLESRPVNEVTNAFYRGIGQQAGQELARQPSLRSIPGRNTAIVAAVALLVCLGTYQFFKILKPWESFSEANNAQLSGVENTSEFALPEDGTAEVRKAWGEVRITEPGGDLKLTKVDVLPLTVEAASSQQLRKAGWITAVNGGSPTDRDLPAPQEPNYAVYQPTLYLDELGLADWDVISYFAKASTEGDDHYASEIYFVEIRPFREDIQKLEGGGGSGSGQCLNKLGSLIGRQQQILRQTYRQIQKPNRSEDQRKQDQGKLGGAQADLEKATGHLYAEVAALDHQNVGTVLDQLALAQESMNKAVGELNEPDNPTAMENEQQSLQQLIESRKDLVKAMSQGKGEGSGNKSSESPPVAGMESPPKDQLEDIENFRDEGKAALNAVREAREKQEQVAKETTGADTQKREELTGRQQQIARDLKEFQEKVPAPFKGLEEEAASAQAAMRQAAAGMQGQGADEATKQAAESLADLENQLNGQLARQALGDVYRMKSMLDAQKEQLSKMEKSPQDFSARDFQQAAKQAQSTKEAMEDTLESTPAGQAFGPELGDALGGAPGQKLNQGASQMQSGNSKAAGQGAGTALAGIESIGNAFEASKPSIMQAEGMAAPTGGSESGVGEAVRKLNSLVQRMTEGRETNKEDLRKQLEDARLALLEESEVQGGDAPQLMAAAEELNTMKEKVDLNVDAEALRKLVDKLESFRLEIADRQRVRPVDPKLLHADPSKAPLEFRERVRRYFEKLSDG